MLSVDIAVSCRGSTGVAPPQRMIIGFGFAFAMAIASIHAFAQNGERSGKAVVAVPAPSAMRPARMGRRRSATKLPGASWSRKD